MSWVISNRIHITIPIEHGTEITNDTRVKDLLYDTEGIIRFNPRQAFIHGIIRCLRKNGIDIFLKHPEFPKVPEGEESVRYYVKDAKKAYPFLFFDTNPLLYRKFYSNYGPNKKFTHKCTRILGSNDCLAGERCVGCDEKTWAKVLEARLSKPWWNRNKKVLETRS